MRLAWFGALGTVNIALIERELEALATAFPDLPILIELVGPSVARQAVQAIAARLAGAFPRFSVSFTAWSLAANEAAIERADFVWLPQEHHAAWGRVKSHNRLVSAIRGGRLAIASPIPSYQELAAYAWMGEPLSEGLRGDGDEVAVFKQECQDHASALCEKFRIDSLAMANALWWEAHDGSGNGSVVFYMFPAECRRIIMEHKAKSVSVTKVLGLRHQVDFDDHQLTVRIEDFHQLKNNKMVIRKAVIGKVIGQRQSPGYPKDFLAIVDVNSLQPAVGKYLGRIRKGAGSSHVHELSPLS